MTRLMKWVLIPILAITTTTVEAAAVGPARFAL